MPCKSITLALTFGGLILLVSSCTKPGNNLLVGTWKETSAETITKTNNIIIQDTTILFSGITVDFTSNGNRYYLSPVSADTTTYSVSNSTLTISFYSYLFLPNITYTIDTLTTHSLSILSIIDTVSFNPLVTKQTTYRFSR
jgi:hypothetical protein